jgi:TRAP-type C4-dicarboxylate transport system permease small subunit
MTKRFSIIYLAFAPLLFGLSWYISHRVYERFMQSGSDPTGYPGADRSVIYASVFTGLYLIAYLIIRDLYKPRNN